MMNRTQKTSTRPPMDNLDRKMEGWRRGGGAVSSRSFDLLNSMIYDLKGSVNLRWLFDPVLHSSLDDLVFLQTLIQYFLLQTFLLFFLASSDTIFFPFKFFLANSVAFPSSSNCFVQTLRHRNDNWAQVYFAHGGLAEAMDITISKDYYCSHH